MDPPRGRVYVKWGRAFNASLISSGGNTATTEDQGVAVERVSLGVMPDGRVIGLGKKGSDLRQL
jgi:hypothetical protein